MKEISRATKGMNRPNDPTATLAAKDRGMITDGVDLQKGYKCVTVVTTSKEAVQQNKWRG